MSELENTYDQYVASLEQKLPKVDPNLVHRVMYLERKLSSEYIKEPQVTLMVEYKPGLDVDKKLFELREKFSLEAEHSDEQNVLFTMGRMKVGKLEEIASDADVAKITGKAAPIIRS
ncbi:MAG: hypothetical protein PVH93_02185 [Nitrosopumilaceae archaeon]|jgi:hypothetical protein